MTRKPKAKPPAAAHTPLPWTKGKYFSFRGVNKKGDSITIGSVYPGSHGESVDGNQEFILRAVNAHDELVDIARSLDKFVGLDNDEPIAGSDAVDFLVDIAKRARFALRKAQGGKP